MWDLYEACGGNVQHLIQIDEWTHITTDLPYMMDIAVMDMEC